MQAFCKEALPLFGHFWRGKRGKRSIATLRESILSEMWISGQPGNPRSIRDGRAMPSLPAGSQNRRQGAKKRQGHHRDPGRV